MGLYKTPNKTLSCRVCVCVCVCVCGWVGGGEGGGVAYQNTTLFLLKSPPPPSRLKRSKIPAAPPLSEMNVSMVYRQHVTGISVVGVLAYLPYPRNTTTFLR